jgi:heme exporter protein B
MNGLSHIFVREEDRGTGLLLRIASSPEAVYLSKLLFNLAFMGAILCVVIPLFLFFLQMTVARAWYFISASAAGGAAITTAATILAAMVSRAGGRGSLFTIISFPIMLPVLWVSITATSSSCNAARAPSWGPVLFLLAFSGFVTAMSFLLFRFVWLDE